jgi:Zn-dependent metalloprotease
LTRGARCALVLAALTAVLVAPGGGQARHEAGARSLAPGTKLAYNRETGEVGFLTTVRGHPVPRPRRIAAGAKPAVAARAFLADHGSLFGIDSQARELRTERTRRETQGRSFVRFQQVHQGVPVMGGELVVQLDGQGNTVATTGEILPNVALDVEPTVAESTAQQESVAAVAKAYRVPAASLSASAPTLEIYDSRILGGPGLGRPALVWRTEVSSQRATPISELVLVDAEVGAVVLHFSQIDTAKNRMTYTANNTSALPGTLRCSESSSFPSCATGDASVEGAHRIIGDVYDFYLSRNGRDSFDNAGGALVSTVHWGSGFDNAAFDTSRNQMIFGDVRTYAQADDVIGHEVTHGVTARESNLFSFYQSGAINESLSDIFGEFIDQTNGTGNDTPAVKWLLGEDVQPGGAARNLKDPAMFGQPARMTDPGYWTSDADNGGVHVNDGIGNKAAYLMTDGDTFNGKAVVGIGLDKVEAIYYEASTNLLTSASDYLDLYNALQQACANLTGTHGITSGDCQQVKNALDAVEMSQPAPNALAEAPVCAAGAPTNLFFDNLENPASGNWTTGALVGSNRWYYPQNSNPFSFDATWATSGTTNFWGTDFQTRTDTFIAQTTSVALPPGTSYLRFDHAYLFETDGVRNYDAGVVEYSTNGGSTWSDAGSLFVNGGYDGTIYSGTSNPLGGRQGFTGYSAGYGSSRLNLAPLAGQNVRFRFRMGLDSTTADYGWFVDDIRIYTCGINTPSAPTGVTATAGDGEATVSFPAPFSGGSPITGYTVRVSPGGQTVTTSGSRVAFVYGLTNGTPYTFTVSATNSAGEGPQSLATPPVIPGSSPGRPDPGPPVGEPRASVPDPPPVAPRPPRPGSTPEL